MCIFGGPKLPTPPPPPAPPPPLPTPADPGVKRARQDNRNKAALAAGRDSTIKTSAQGLTTLTSDKKTLLGA